MSLFCLGLASIVLKSHMQTHPSLPPVTTNLSSWGANVTLLTLPLCPARTARQSAREGSKTPQAKSPPPETRSESEGEKERVKMALLCA